MRDTACTPLCAVLCPFRSIGVDVLIRHILPACVALGMLAGCSSLAWAQAAGQAQSPAAASPSAERADYMGDTFRQFELTVAGRPEHVLSQTPEPILRYSNPVRNFFSDGCTYLWLGGERPVAAGTISIRGKGAVHWEFSSLTSQPLRCNYLDAAVWTPQTGNLVEQQVADGPVPAANARLRLLQHRQVARRFAVMQHDLDNGLNKPLRMLPQPVYRWADAEAGVIDGAMFAFCETTDPEALLMIEAVRSQGAAKASWRYTMARMTSRPLTFSHDEKVVKKLEGYWTNPRSPNDSYASQKLGMYPP
jgi:hypothetical protein